MLCSHLVWFGLIIWFGPPGPRCSCDMHYFSREQLNAENCQMPHIAPMPQMRFKRNLQEKSLTVQHKRRILHEQQLHSAPSVSIKPELIGHQLTAVCAHCREQV